MYTLPISIHLLKKKTLQLPSKLDLCVQTCLMKYSIFLSEKKRTKLTTTTKQEFSYCNNQAYKVLGNSDLKF